MNKIFKCIYNQATGTFVAVSELARSKVIKSSSSNTSNTSPQQTSGILFKLSALFASILTALSANTAFAADVAVQNNAGDHKTVVVNGGTDAQANSAGGIAVGGSANAVTNGSIAIGGGAVAGQENAAWQGVTIPVSASFTYQGQQYNLVEGKSFANEKEYQAFLNLPRGSKLTVSGGDATKANLLANDFIRSHQGHMYNIAIGEQAAARGGRNVSIGEHAGAAKGDSWDQKFHDKELEKEIIADNWNIHNVNLGTYAGANSKKDYSVAIGYQAGALSEAVAKEQRSIHNGADYGGRSPSVLIGKEAGKDSITYGTVAIGNGAGVGMRLNTSISDVEKRDSKSNVFLGTSAGAGVKTNNGFVDHAPANGAGSNIGIGTGALQTSVGDANIAMGIKAGSKINGDENTVIGNFAIAGGDWKSFTRNIVLGNQATIASGSGTETWDKNVIIGDFANGNSTGFNMKRAVVVGGSSHVRADFGTVVGAGSVVDVNAINGTALGAGSLVKSAGVNGIAVGKGATVEAKDAIAEGTSAVASAESAIAIGNGAKAKGEKSISIGTGNEVTGAKSGAIGDPSTVSGAGSYAIGNNNTLPKDNTFILGNGVTATQPNSVILGNESADKEAKAVTTAEVNGINYGGFAGTGKASYGVVSVAKAGAERQIVNVAPGEISASSTDAINGSQLWNVLEKGGITFKNTGSKGESGGEQSSFVKFGDTVTLEGDGDVQVLFDKDSNTFTIASHVEPGLGSFSVDGDNSNALTIDSENPSLNIKGDESLIETVSDGSNTVNIKATDKLKSAVTQVEANKTNIEGNKTNIQNNANEIAKGTKYAGDYKSDNAKANEFARPLGEVTNIKGGKASKDDLTDGNIGVESDGESTLTVKLAKKINLGDGGEVKMTNDAGDEVTLNGDGLVVSPKVSSGNQTPIKITKDGIDAGNHNITNLASGGDTDSNAANIGDVKRIAKATQPVVKGAKQATVSTKENNGVIEYTVSATKTTVEKGSDAVNVTAEAETPEGILNYKVDLAKTTKDNIQKGVDADTAVKTKGIAFGGDAGTVVTKKLGEQVDVKGGITDEGKVTTGNIGVFADGASTLNVKLAKDLTGLTSAVFGDSTTINGDGVTIKDGPKIVKDGIDAGGKKITGVAEGTDGTDAVNLDQLNKAIKGATPNVGKFGLTSDDGKAVQKDLDNTISVKGDDNITTSTIADDGIKVSLNKDVNLGDDGSVTTGSTVINKDGVTTPKVTTGDTVVESGKVTGLDPRNPVTNKSDYGTGENAGRAATESAVKAVDDKVNTNTTNIAGNTTKITALEEGWTVDVGNEGTGQVTSTTNAKAVKAGETVKVQAGDNMAVKLADKTITLATKDEVTFKKVTIKNGDNSTDLTSTADGLDVGGDKITNVADGNIAKDSKDAVNGGQLNDVKTVADSALQSWDAKVNGEVAKTVNKDSNNVNFVNGDNIVISKEGNGDIKVSTSKTPTFDSGTVNNAGNNNYITEGNKNIVNGGDVYNAIQASAYKYKGDNGDVTISRTPKETLSVLGGATDMTENNIGTVGDAGGSITVKLAKNLTKLGSVAIENGPTINSDGINMGDKPITNMSMNTTPDDKDAVNVEYLKNYVKNNTADGTMSSFNVADKTTTARIENAETVTFVDGDGTVAKVTDKGNTAGADVTFDLSEQTKKDIKDGKDAKEAVDNKGLTFAGDSGKSGVKKLGDEVKVTGDSNITTKGVDGGIEIALNNEVNLTEAGSLTIGDTVVNKEGVTTPKVTTGKTTVEAGKVMGLDDRKPGDSNITDYGTGDNATRAATEGAVKKVSDDVNAVDTKLANAKFGLTAADGKSVEKPLNGKIEVIGADDNITTKVADGKVQIELAKTLDLGNTGSVTMGDTKVSNDGLTITNGPSVKKDGIDAGNKKITNVTDGAIGPNSKDAVNGSQLHATNTRVDTLESGWNLTTGEDGGKAEGTTVAAIKATNTVTVKAGKNIAIKQAGKDMTIATAKEVEFDKVTTGPVVIDKDEGINAGNKQIKGVAAGTDDTDAVNVKQLNDAVGAGSYNFTVSDKDGAKSAVAKGKDVKFVGADGVTVKRTGDANEDQKFEIGLDNEVTVGKDGKPGKIGVAGENGKDGVAIDGKDGGTIVVGGEDGKAGKDGVDGKPGVALNGKDGSIGLTGKDGKSTITVAAGKPGLDGIGANGKDGADGKTETRIVYTDKAGNPQEVANLNDGLMFQGNNTDKDVIKKKLNTVMTIKGENAGTSVSGANMYVENNGTDLIVKMAKDLTELDTVTVGSGDNATKIDGNNGNVTVGGSDGTKIEKGKITGLDARDPASNAADYGVGDNANRAATESAVKKVSDKAGDNATNIAKGLDFSGDYGVADTNTFNRKLGQETKVVGGAEKADLTDKNIGVVSNGIDTLTVKLSKNLTDLEKVTFGPKDGDPTSTVSIGKDGVNAGGKTITNVKAGEKGTDAVNKDQLEKAISDNAYGFTVSDNGTDKKAVVKGKDVAFKGADKGGIVVTRSGEDNADQTFEFKLDKDVTVGDDTNPGTITVKGKDGKDGVSIKGEDGSIGLAGKDGANGKLTVGKGADGLDGKNGKDGKDRLKVNDEDVATLNDGLKFQGNKGGEIAKKLNETLSIKGALADNKEASAANIRVDNDGGELIIKLAKELQDLDKVVVGGKDGVPGKDGTPGVALNGKDGSIGVAGKDGANADITTNKGPAFLGGKGDDGKDGADGTRITYQPKDKDGNPVGNPKQVATMDDGIAYTGDVGAANVKLNKITNITGGVKDETKLSDNNIGVVAKQNGENADLTIKLAKNLSDLDNVVFGKAKDDGTAKDPKTTVSIGKDGVNAGGKQITNVASGLDGTKLADATGDMLTNAANIGDLQSAVNNITDAAKGGGFGLTDDNGTKVTQNLGKQIQIKGVDGITVTAKDADKDNRRLEIGLSNDLTVGKDGKDGSIGVNGKDGKPAVAINGKDGGSIVVGGKDGVPGKDGTPGVALNGKDGSIGVAGKDGANADITTNKGPAFLGGKGDDGKDGKDGKDGTRITYQPKDKDGNPVGDPKQVATMDDGIAYKGDQGEANVKLNKVTSIVGGATGELADGNIGVVADQDGDNAKLTVKLAKDLKGLNSVTTTDAAGNTTVVNGGGVSITGTNAEGKPSNVSLTANGLDNGGNKITNVADGDISPTSKDAVNGSQLVKYVNENSGWNISTNGQDQSAVKPNSTVDFGSADGSIGVSKKVENGVTKVDLALGNDVNIGGPGKDGKDGADGKLAVNGKDGKTGVVVNGKDGTIGLTGPAGKDGKNPNAVIGVKDGAPGLDGNDGQNGESKTRVVYTKPDGNVEEVATLNDGVKYEGDQGQAAVKLNQTTKVVGGAKGELTDGNIGVVASQEGKNAKLTVKLAKDLKGLNSVEANNVTVKQGGNLKVENGANVDMGGNQVKNIASGISGKTYRDPKDNNAANIGDVKAIANQAVAPLHKRIGDVDKRASAGTASAMAAAGLPQAYLPGHSMVAVGAGTHRGQNAIAVGVSRISDSGHVVIKLNGATNSKGDTSGSVGVGYQ
ncbi:YadA-like family protein, partial [Spirabiliibacterium falconis]|uniref:YadA-like family protein n=1 Tax=Spirabiliibacterium falconis TaxID=572023 RepID=UPI001AAD4CAE